jgi:glycine/D-amino acid oxidase-like deaminating enzyme
VEQQATVCSKPVGTMVGSSEKVAVEYPGWAPKTNWALMPQMLAKAKKRCPFLVQRSMISSRTRYWEVTPDDHPIIGHDKSLNLFTTAGFSGHGISMIPGLASSIAAAFVGESPEIDLGFYDPERFENGHSKSIELWGSADWCPD